MKVCFNSENFGLSHRASNEAVANSRLRVY